MYLLPVWLGTLWWRIPLVLSQVVADPGGGGSSWWRILERIDGLAERTGQGAAASVAKSTDRPVAVRYRDRDRQEPDQGSFRRAPLGNAPASGLRVVAPRS